MQFVLNLHWKTPSQIYIKRDKTIDQKRNFEMFNISTHFVGKIRY